MILQVASATATFGMMYSASLSVVQYYLLNRFPVPYGEIKLHILPFKSLLNGFQRKHGFQVIYVHFLTVWQRSSSPLWLPLQHS